MKISLFRRILSKRTRTKNELVSSLPGFLSSVKDNFIAVLLNILHTGPLSSCATLSDKPGFRKLQRWGTGKSIEKKKRKKKGKKKREQLAIQISIIWKVTMTRLAETCEGKSG